MLVRLTSEIRARQKFPGGYRCIFPPFSLIQNRTGDFDASFTHLRRSALQPLPQCTASALAVHCIRPCSALPLFTANVCILSRKRLQPPSQTFASAIANVCGEKMVKRRLLWNPFPHVFIVSRVFPLSSIACLRVRCLLLHYRHSKRIPDETGIHDTKRGKR